MKYNSESEMHMLRFYCFVGQNAPNKRVYIVSQTDKQNEVGRVDEIDVCDDCFIRVKSIW